MTTAQPNSARLPRCVIYIRMSMDRKGDGAGLDRQEQACRALALARGWEVVDVVDDTISATTVRLADRPGWQRCVKTIEAGQADYIVAWHLDRVTRSMKDLESLIELALERGVGLATATGDIDLTTDVGRMVARILAAVAAAETERKAERQILANDQRVAAGKPQWIRRPFGFEQDGTHRVAEAKAIRDAYRHVAQGKSLAEVAREWTAAGFKTTAPDPSTARQRQPRTRAYNPTGEWNGVAVRAVLRHPRNIGKITLYGEVMGKAAWKPIVTEAQWKKVQAVLDDRKRPDFRWGIANLLTGIAICDACDGNVTANRRNGVPIYQCDGSGGRGRGHVQIDLEYADAQILRRMIDRMAKTGRISFAPPAECTKLEPLQAEEDELKGRMAELVQLRAASVITVEALTEGTADLRRQLAGVQAEIAEALRWGGPVTYVDIEAAYEEWDRMELVQRRDYVRAAFEVIRIKQRGKGRRKAGTPQWLPEHLFTVFAPGWEPATA